MSSNFSFSTKGYTPEFCHAVRFILIEEGALYRDGTPKPGLGYVNNPKDPGGETKGGISKRAFPGIDIASLTLDKIVRLYYTNYWKPAYCPEWSGAIALYAFDSAVQHGATNAIRMLQEISGTKPDGKVGPNTRAAVHSGDVEYLCARYGLRRARFYARILKNNYSQTAFIEGWHNRLVHLTDAAWELQ
ncbi:glycoside hydrolase family 108 protein [Vibrio parahaemolyticus]|uniref:glycoside hydrolase family 108 protein n=1 Tax=Vibrio parahaemolyticus TaxID=670 RepID=UPI0028DE1696|nr:putative peptidoglycan-binding domain-containing protein [Vibrio parahaemolyticus]MDT8844777.1 N-acetylmuramidase [Vibrio parahaemolyticus]MDT8917137.1 N-acetylmuramidase [Vibrio parahaemolyticus]